MASPPFTWTVRKSGDVVINHHGRPAGTLRGAQAAKFLTLADRGDEDAAQAALARLTGNYKRGNERQAKGHQRNG